ncbi:MAG: hypothetical protein ACRD0U_07350 [Acidimicrobiales bacterium]
MADWVVVVDTNSPATAAMNRARLESAGISTTTHEDSLAKHQPTRFTILVPSAELAQARQILEEDVSLPVPPEWEAGPTRTGSGMAIEWVLGVLVVLVVLVVAGLLIVR